jgi:hypothetical protein
MRHTVTSSLKLITTAQLASAAWQRPERWRQPLRIPPPQPAMELGREGGGGDAGSDGSFAAMLAALLAGRDAACAAKDMSEL